MMIIGCKINPEYNQPRQEFNSPQKREWVSFERPSQNRQIPLDLIRSGGIFVMV